MAWSGFRNRKDGPQQGTLFDVRQVPSQPVDSPGMQRRGRRAEMMSALPAVAAGAGSDSFDEVRGKIEQRRGSGRPDVFTPGTRDEAEEKAALSERARLARKVGNETSLEAGHFEGIGVIQVGTGSVDAEATAEYTPERVGSPPQLHFRGDPRPSTLAHEVGHHVSMGQQGNRAIAGVTQMARLNPGGTLWPAEEGRADAFMHQHTVGEPKTSYARVKGFAEGTEYGLGREEWGSPLTEREREWQGMPKRVLQPDLFGDL